jgi:hypothetical protein
MTATRFASSGPVRHMAGALVLVAASLPVHAAYVAEQRPALTNAAFALRDRLAASGELGSFAAVGGVEETLDPSGVAVPAIAVPAPEPETYVLMLAGLGVVGWAARRRRSA